MTAIIDMLRGTPAARRFFLAYAQSALGSGVGYVALILVAYQRFHSGFAVAAVLGAGVVPLMVLGPMLGGAADRLPRRACLVGADLVRAVAFLGIATIHGLPATIALATLAGIGTGVFNPAALAGLPHAAGERHAAAATSLYSALSMMGKTVGPLAAAAVLAGGGVDLALAANGASFLISAALVATIDFGRPSADGGEDRGESETGPRLRGVPGFGPVVAISSLTVLFTGLSTVAEPRFITGDLGAPSWAFSVMVGLWGIGVFAGSLAGSGGGAVGRLWVRYLAGIGLMGAGYAAAAAAPDYALTLPGFVLAGLGDGILLVHERLLVQTLVPERAWGRAFGSLDMVAAWAFAAALGGGALAVAGPGARVAVLAAGLGTLAVWLVAAAGTTARAARRAGRAPVPETT